MNQHMHRNIIIEQLRCIISSLYIFFSYRALLCTHFTLPESINASIWSCCSCSAACWCGRSVLFICFNIKQCESRLKSCDRATVYWGFNLHQCTIPAFLTFIWTTCFWTYCLSFACPSVPDYWEITCVPLVNFLYSPCLRLFVTATKVFLFIWWLSIRFLRSWAAGWATGFEDIIVSLTLESVWNEWMKAYECNKNLNVSLSLFCWWRP